MVTPGASISSRMPDPAAVPGQGVAAAAAAQGQGITSSGRSCSGHERPCQQMAAPP
jgi:hypothetical protein